jgi:hypothetical protein
MLQKEALIWRQLDHPFILQFMGVDRDVFQPYICMVAPWLPHGNVMSYMQREGPNTVQVQHFVSSSRSRRTGFGASCQPITAV